MKKEMSNKMKSVAGKSVEVIGAATIGATSAMAMEIIQENILGNVDTVQENTDKIEVHQDEEQAHTEEPVNPEHIMIDDTEYEESVIDVPSIDDPMPITEAHETELTSSEVEPVGLPCPEEDDDLDSLDYVEITGLPCPPENLEMDYGNLDDTYLYLQEDGNGTVDDHIIANCDNDNDLLNDILNA